MGVNCGATFAKYVLFAFNVLFFLGGAAALGVGIWLRVDSGSFLTFLTTVDPSGQSVDITGNIIGNNLSTVYTVAYILIGIGAFVFLVGFMGCCGACKEWRPLLIGYAICLIIIMCTEIGVGIAVGVYKDQVIGEMETAIQRDWIGKYSYVNTNLDPANSRKVKVAPTALSDADRIATSSFNALHVAFGCCGLRGFTDFTSGTSPYGRNGHNEPPVFCCKFEKPSELILSNANCFANRDTTNSFMNDGCLTKIEKFIQDYAPAVIGVTVGIGLIELIGVFFAFCLCCAIGDERKYR